MKEYDLKCRSHMEEEITGLGCAPTKERKGKRAGRDTATRVKLAKKIVAGLSVFRVPSLSAKRSNDHHTEKGTRENFLRGMI